MENIYQQINQLINASSRILIVSHRNPDEDALGSCLCLAQYLRGLNKTASVFNVNQPAKYLNFLAGTDEIINDQKVFKEDWDLVFFLDCGSIANTGLSEDVIKNLKIVNIDHHASNPYYGIVNLVDYKIGSTCELVYEYLHYNNFKFDKQSATCLLAGILADTSGFVHATTSRTVKIASELVGVGLKINQIFNFAVRNKTLSGLRVWGEALSKIKINEEFGIAYTWIKEEDLKFNFINFEEIDGLANFLNVIADVKATVLFRIGSDYLRANWRTKRNDIDLSLLCSYFGGGGHKKASGFSVPWRVVEKNGELVIL